MISRFKLFFVQTASFGMVVNIEGAHNLVPVREENQRHQCCRVGEDAGLYVLKVGTFGVGSAPTTGGRRTLSSCPVRHFHPRVLLALRDG